MVDGQVVTTDRETIRRFEVMTAPLIGTMLIDASAGTGKTYTIAALVVRLLVERGLELKDILVVTFTEAAAEDLRGRIRQGIRKAALAFESGRGEDEFLQGLLAAWPEHDRAAARLNLVLRNFDEAAVFTIHGFCQRVLAEHSLETGVLFDSELVTDLRELLRRIVEDYFRTSFYQESELVVGYCLKFFSPENMRGRLGNLYDREDIEVRPQLDGAVLRQGLAAAECDYRAAFARVAQFWPRRRESVREFLLESEGLNRKKYKKESLPGWLAAMETLLGRAEPPIELFEKFGKFTTEGLLDGLKKGHDAPDEPFFARCDELLESHRRFADLLARYALLLESGLFGYVRRGLMLRKAEEGVHSFDDLLTRLCLALRGPGGPALAATLRQQYRAALIDEFQDTDPVQYEIFTSVFNHPDSLLYLIGDPKQAIYSFRGADIFAYIRAVRDIGERFTLIDNWRSVPGLITAVNTIFAAAAQPFVFPEILFAPACPAEKPHTPLLLAGVEEPPFLIRTVRRAAGEVGAKPLSKEAAGRLILLDLAAEISRLLELGRQDCARLGERPLAAGDIAVLVRTNRQARQVQEALAEAGIASVLNSSESLFASREAVEVGILLRAVSECASSRRLRAALATRLLAVPVRELDLFREEVSLDGWYERFRLYHDLWEAGGFVRMFGEFLDREGVRERLLARPGGERALTNVLHLQEVLHTAAAGQKLGMTGLLKYLHDLIAAAADSPAEELQLRLASDAELVQIITIHKAKGLQYPVVFCPFSWEGSQVLGRETRAGAGPLCRYLFHEQTGTDYRLVLDLGSEQLAVSREQALREELAENLRLLYVALTRAINRCYLFWGPFASAGTSAAAYLLHGAGTAEEGGLSSWATDRLAGLDDVAIIADLNELSRQSGGSVRLEVMGETSVFPAFREDAGAAPLNRRVFRGQCRDDWRIESFSSLHHFREAAAVPRPAGLAVARDGEKVQTGDYFSDLANFPAGPGPGTFLHGLLEELDFSGAGPERAVFLREKLRVAGFDARWAPLLAAMLDDLLHTPLTPEEPALTLAGVGGGERISELEFYFPLAVADPGRLASLLSAGVAGPGGRHLSGLVGQRSDGLQGMMKGYIDLVFRFGERFYLLDWKSNYLGPALEDYAVGRLPEVMVREGYCLQYLIYSVALHRYLGQRLPGYSYDAHFGGVFYLFLRGVNRRAGWDSGIFRNRPDRQLIEKLSVCLAGG
jgi:exodeoxyribonuclease V beta subunit